MVQTTEKRRSFPVRVVGSLGSVAKATWMPYHSQSIPFRDIALASPTDRDAQAKEWRDMKLTELNIVSVTGALVAGVVTGTIAWPYPKPWTVTAFWLSALVFALFSVVLATQQSIVLSRSASGTNSLRNLRVLMGAIATPSTTDQTEVFVPNNSTLFVWQAATMLLGVSIMVLLVGLMVFVYDAASTAGGWGPEAKIALWFSLSMLFGAVTYMVSWMGTELRLQQLLLEDEKDIGHGVEVGV